MNNWLGSYINVLGDRLGYGNNNFSRDYREVIVGNLVNEAGDPLINEAGDRITYYERRDMRLS